MKTRVYEPRSADGFELCHPVRPEDFEFINVLVDGTRREREWSSPEFRLIRYDEGVELQQSDSPWLGAHALILRRRAVDVYREALEGQAEFLRVRCPDAELWLFNPRLAAEALDEGASSAWRFSDGRIMRVTRYAFRTQVVRDLDVFKVPNLRISPTFVSEQFVTMWMGSGLRGLEFEEVWAE